MDTTNVTDLRKLLMALIRLLLIVLAVGITANIYLMGTARFPWAAFVVWTILAATAVYLRRGGSVKIAVWVTIASFFSGFTVSAIYTGGFEGPMVALAPFLPVLVILLVNAKAGWIGTAATLSLLSVVALLQSFGFTQPLPISDAGLVLLQYLLVAFATIVVAWVVADFADKSSTFSTAILLHSQTDFVTGVANRRRINDSLKQETERAGRAESHLSVILIDIDFFKRFNDTNGHQAGDQCLATVAEVLKVAAKRSIDVIGRYGGDEFIMLLPSTDASAAAVIAEQVRSEMLSRSLYYDNEGKDKVSLTLGIASLRGRAIKSPEHLIKLADDALLHGKAHGRNTISSAIISARSGLVTFKCRQPSAAF